jgi:ubiquinone/menaquinone biosynthesis C-methylase UbiE
MIPHYHNQVEESRMNKNEIHSVKKYDSIAKDYEASFDGKFSARYKDKMLELIKVSDNDRVLDVGCGNGSLINRISQKADIKAYGVDISPNMIEECRKKYSNIQFEVTTGENLPFNGNYFDIVTICCVLHHLHNPSTFFNEAKRVLKPDGTLMIAEPLFYFPAKQITDYIISPLIKAGDNKLFSHSRLKKYFIENGFVITEVFKKGSIQIITGRKTY